MIRILTIKEVEYIAHKLAKEWMTRDEPIPHLETRYPSISEI